MPKCAAIKNDGQRCERVIGAAQQFCYSHDPDRVAERSANASKAARSRVGGELPAIKKQLRELADAVVEGTVERGSAAVASQLYGVLLRALELERRVKETEELEGRLASLEQLGPGGRAWGP